MENFWSISEIFLTLETQTLTLWYSNHFNIWLFLMMAGTKTITWFEFPRSFLNEFATAES
jgi:hypothetical protein